MSNLLQFALGLNAGGFIAGLGDAGAKLAAFTGVVLTFGAIEEKVMGQIEKGAALELLSRRTSQSVEALVRLQAGFKVAGLAADGVGPMIYKLQQALGGFDEMGRSTHVAFAAVGTSIAALKGLDAPGQLQLIAKGFEKLTPEAQAFAAARIFGRGGGADFLQLAGDSEAFAKAMEKAGTKAKIFAENAHLFHEIELAFTQIKAKADGLWLGIAAGVAPVLKFITDGFKKIDLTPIGVGIGDIFRTVAGALASGRFGELISLSFKAGLEQSLLYFQAFVETIAQSMAAIIGSAQLWKGIALVAGAAFTDVFASIAGGIADYLGTLRDKFAPTKDGFIAQSFNSQIDALRQLQSGGKFWAGIEGASGENAITSAVPNLVNSLAEAIKKIGDVPLSDAAKVLKEKAREMADSIKPIEHGAKGRGEGGIPSETAGKSGKDDVNAWERIGAIFGAGEVGNSLETHARETATNTRQLIQEIQLLPEKLAFREFNFENL